MSVNAEMLVYNHLRTLDYVLFVTVHHLVHRPL